jgi:excisionase family DNA binding protein
MNDQKSIILQGITLPEFFEGMKSYFQTELLPALTPAVLTSSMVTEKEACEITGVTRQTLKNHRDKMGIRYERFGRTIRYHREDLLQFCHKRVA